MRSILIASLTFLTISVFAQSLSRPDTTYVLNELVISAYRIPEMRNKISQQVKIFSATQLANLNSQTTADLISNSGVVAMQKSQQGGGSPQLRGFEASRVVLVIDGVRMNNLIYRAGHLQNIITLDNSALERAEILFGPSSTVYGSDALGGVIHFLTKNVQLSEGEKKNFSGNVFSRVGTVNAERTNHFDINLGGRNFGSFTSFTYSDFGDLKMGKTKNPALGEEFGLSRFYVQRLPDNSRDILIENSNPYVQKFSGYSQYDILQKFLFKQNNRIDHIINFQFSNSSNIPRYDRLTDPEGAGLRMAEWNYGPQKRMMAAYQVQIRDLGKLADTFSSTLSYQYIEESRHDRRFNGPNRRNQIENVDVVGLTMDLQKLWSNSNLRYGFDGQLNNLTSTAFSQNIMDGVKTSVATRYPDGKNSMNYAAIFATHTVEISKQVTLNDGVRIGMSSLYSRFNDKTFFPFPFDEVKQMNYYASANLGLVYHPATQWKYSLTSSTGYRVPNIDDLAKVFDTNAGESLIVPNPNIKPEKTINVEVNISKVFADKIRWDNTVFYTSFFDALVQDAFIFNGQSTIDYEGQPTQVIATQNKRRAFIGGLCSVLQGTLSKKISMNASFNFTYGRVKTDTVNVPLDHIAPSFGRVDITYHTNNLRGEVFVNYSGWKHLNDYLLNSEDNEVYATPEGMPAWYTINLRAGYTITKSIAIQAGVDNLLDLQYRTFSSGINAPGRNIFGTLRVHF